MPQYVSDRGKHYPAKESVSLVYKGEKSIPREDLPPTVTIPAGKKTLEPGDSFLYDGPDRAAIQQLNEQGVEFLGQDFKEDPEFHQMVRNRGFNNADEFLKAIGYDAKKAEEEFKNKAERVSRHELPKRVAEIKVLGGGKDETGNKGANIIGGFGDQRMRSEKELNKK